MAAEDGSNLGPEVEPALLLFRGQLFQLARLAHAFQAGFIPPARQRQPNGPARLRRASFQRAVPGGQVLTQPLPCLLAPACPLVLPETCRIRAVAATCQCSGASGIVAVADGE